MRVNYKVILGVGAESFFDTEHQARTFIEYLVVCEKKEREKMRLEKVTYEDLQP